MTLTRSPINPLDLVKTPRGAVKTLRAVLDWIKALDRAAWNPAALRPGWPRGLPAPTPERRPAAARRALAKELRLIRGWLTQRADGEAVDFPVPGLRLSLRAPAGGGPGEIAVDFSEGYDPPAPHVLRAMVAVALQKAAVSRCARPTCASLFIRPARGRPKRYCGDQCAWAERARQWRAEHHEQFRTYRNQAYFEGLKKRHGSRVRIQARRPPRTS